MLQHLMIYRPQVSNNDQYSLDGVYVIGPNNSAMNKQGDLRKFFGGSVSKSNTINTYAC